MSTPRPFLRPVPPLWWLRRPGYIRYMLREITCVFVGAYSGWLVIALMRLGQGPAAWAGFRAAMTTPAGVTFQLLTLVAALYHTVTWFGLAPRTMPLRMGGERVPPGRIELAHYIVWAVLTVAILILAGV